MLFIVTEGEGGGVGRACSVEAMPARVFLAGLANALALADLLFR